MAETTRNTPPAGATGGDTAGATGAAGAARKAPPQNSKRADKDRGGCLKRFGCLLTLLILLILLATPLILWWVMPESPWRVRVIDMTAPHPNYREHDALFWVFNYNKVIPPGTQRTWVDDNDYIGYYPEPSDFDRGVFYTRRIGPDDLRGVDMLYIADSYGVYVNDYDDEVNELTHLDYSRLIFGGFSDDEAQLIESFHKSGRAVVAEFNTFASPTNLTARRRLEKLFGVRWTGWAGRFFTDLDDKDSVPVWARRHWQIHYNEAWPHKGPGWLFAHEDTRIFVLLEPGDAEPRALRITDIKEDDPITAGLYDNVPFYFWFDVNELMEGTELLARYQFHLTKSGRAIMKEFGLPLTWPAVVRTSKQPLCLYMSGDFTDLKVQTGPHTIWGYAWYKRIGRFSEHYRDQTAFYWQFYVTLLSNIIGSPVPPGHDTLPEAAPVRLDGLVPWYKKFPRRHDGGIRAPMVPLTARPTEAGAATAPQSPPAPVPPVRDSGAQRPAAPDRGSRP